MSDNPARGPASLVRERLIETLLAGNVDYAILAVDLEGRVITWNEGARNLFGWTEDDIIGQPVDVVFTPEDCRNGVPQAEMQSVLERGRSGDERWHQKKDGSRFWANGVVMPLRDKTDAVQGFIKILRDHTKPRRAAEAQRADAEFLRSILAASGDCIKVLDLDAKLEFMSEGGKRVMEVSDFNAIQGCPWPDFWAGEGHAAAKAAVEAAKAGGVGQFQGPANTMAGTPKWWDVQVTPMLGADGKPEKLLVVSRDITATSEAEAALRDSEARWRGLFEQMQEGFFVGEVVRDADGRMYDFTFSELNPAFEAQTGISAAKAGRRPARALVPGMPDYIIDIYAKVVETGEPAQFEVQVPALNNRWFEARARRAGPERFAVLFVDISDRKIAEQATLDSETRFRSLAQSMPNHVWTARTDGQLDWFNDRVYAYAGAPPGALDGDGWAALVHPDDIATTARIWADARAKGALYQTEFRLRRHDGIYRWHIARAVPIRDTSNAVQRWIGTNTDIEDQKTAEAALANLATTLEQRVEARTAELIKTQDALRQSQKMEAIGNLTGGVAHDFNNLLQVISGNLQLLAKDVVGNDRAQQRAQNAMAGVERGAKLASQLLAFSRRQPLAPKVVNIGRFIRNMEDILRGAIGEAVEIETIIADGLWDTLVDPGNVENVLLNLAINARDAMDGQGRLTIEAENATLDDDYARSHAEVAAGQYVLLAVTDTGCGIPPEIIDKVFEPFFSTKPEGKGTGLGLSMVYGFVKQSGGHVKIYSEPGHGTTIKLYLPRSLEAEDVLIDAEAKTVAGGSETILVAEDDDAVRQTVVAMLTDLGYRVLTAKDAQSALTIVENDPSIDLLFTDVIMPGPLKSPELARRARLLRPHIGVLFTSGYTENSVVHAGRLDADVELLSKPYTRETLARRLRPILDQGKARDPGGKPASDRAGALTFLVCEDDWLIRMSTVEMLQDLGHTAIDAADAKTALSILAAQQVDILLTDIGLPDMSGVTLAEQARSRIAALPIIFATGDSSAENAMPGPPVGFVAKPYNAETLMKVIAALTQ